jgi:hypothetical protein
VVPNRILSIVKVADSSYAQLSSSETQIGGPTGKALALNSIDAAKEVENDKGIVTVKKAGTYFVVAAGQVGSSGGSGQGSDRLWLRQNGKDVDNSNTEQTVTPKYTAVPVCQEGRSQRRQQAAALSLRPRRRHRHDRLRPQGQARHPQHDLLAGQSRLMSRDLSVDNQSVDKPARRRHTSRAPWCGCQTSR